MEEMLKEPVVLVVEDMEEVVAEGSTIITHFLMVVMEDRARLREELVMVVTPMCSQK